MRRARRPIRINHRRGFASQRNRRVQGGPTSLSILPSHRSINQPQLHRRRNLSFLTLSLNLQSSFILCIHGFRAFGRNVIFRVNRWHTYTYIYKIPRHKSTGTQTRYKSFPGYLPAQSYFKRVGASLTSPLLALPAITREQRGWWRREEETERRKTISAISPRAEDLNRFVGREGEGEERDGRREVVGDEALGAEAETRRASCNAVYKLANKNKGGGGGGEVGISTGARQGQVTRRGLPLWAGRLLLLDFYKVDA